MTHRFPVRVFYEDTDMGGIVYHANFLKFIERARSDWVRDLGLDQNAMRAAGVIFVVRRVEADFLAPALFDDALEVETRTLRASGARLVLAQEVRHGDDTLFRAVVTVACMDQAGRPTRLPSAILAQPADTAPDQGAATTRR